MDVCGPAAIPLQWFLGGPYEWDPLSRDAQLAWAHDQKLRCSDCGEYEDDWKDPKTGLRLEGRRAPKIVHTHVCPGCEALELDANRDEKAERKPGAKRYLIWRSAASPVRRRRRSR